MEQASFLNRNLEIKDQVLVFLLSDSKLHFNLKIAEKCFINRNPQCVLYLEIKLLRNQDGESSSNENYWTGFRKRKQLMRFF